MTVSLPVWAIALPVPITNFPTFTVPLQVLYGEGITIRQQHGCMVFYTEGDPCPCLVCEDLTNLHVLRARPDVGIIPRLHWTANACATCNNRDCPRTDWHLHPCKKQTADLFARINT